MSQHETADETAALNARAHAEMEHRQRRRELAQHRGHSGARAPQIEGSLYDPANINAVYGKSGATLAAAVDLLPSDAGREAIETQPKSKQQ